MSHEDASHATVPVHVPAPRHARLQVLPLHAIGPVHEPAPTQLMVHALAAVQSIVEVHDPAPVQVTVHGTPDGHATGPVHIPAIVQSTRQVPPSSHVPRPASAQTEGHVPAASLTGASPASASRALRSPAPPSEISRSPRASRRTPASFQAPFASRTVASASMIVPGSWFAASLPSTARPQPKAINGTAISTTRGRARWSKTAKLHPTRRAEQGLHVGKPSWAGYWPRLPGNSTASSSTSEG